MFKEYNKHEKEENRKRILGDEIDVFKSFIEQRGYSLTDSISEMMIGDLIILICDYKIFYNKKQIEHERQKN